MSKIEHVSGPTPEGFPWDRKEFTKQPDGTYTVSVRAAARMAQCDQSGLGKSLKSGAAETPSKMARHLLAQGVSGEDLATWNEDGIPEPGLALLLEYFAFHAERPSARARQYLRTFSAYGIHKAIDNLLGVKPPKVFEPSQRDILRRASVDSTKAFQATVIEMPTGEKVGAKANLMSKVQGLFQTTLFGEQKATALRRTGIVVEDPKKVSLASFASAPTLMLEALAKDKVAIEMKYRALVANAKGDRVSDASVFGSESVRSVVARLPAEARDLGIPVEQWVTATGHRAVRWHADPSKAELNATQAKRNVARGGQIELFPD